MALLTIQEQQVYKPISPNWAAQTKVVGGLTNFAQLQIEVEEKELRKLIGASFLQAIQTTPANYTTLLSGGSYVDSHGDTVNFKGLKYILAFLNYSKYVGESFIADTFSGMVSKKREETTNITSGDIKRLQGDAQEIAMQEWELLEYYLCENYTLYPLWHYNHSTKPFKPMFRSIKKTRL